LAGFACECVARRSWCEGLRAEGGRERKGEARRERERGREDRKGCFEDGR
jgi:hypothetical protein